LHFISFLFSHPFSYLFSSLLIALLWEEPSGLGTQCHSFQYALTIDSGRLDAQSLVLIALAPCNRSTSSSSHRLSNENLPVLTP
jgi:hypothetical protein